MRLEGAIARSLCIVFLAACAVGCHSGQATTAGAPGPEAHYHLVAASTPGEPRGWVLLLPGSSGLDVFGDTTHYFDAANRFGELGYNALIVDYKPAYRAADRDARPSGSAPTGEKIAWVAEQAVEWGRAQGSLGRDAPGAVVGWSLGAHGVWRLVGDGSRARDMRLFAAAVYYPVIDDAPRTPPSVPVLILTGEADDVTEAAPITSLADAYTRAGGDVRAVVYPDALHGFDIRSITEPRTLRILPLIGPKATLGYDNPAADAAERELSDFLKARL